MSANKYLTAAEQIKNADAILISAGAGMGVDSGLPDFRGNRGFWNAYPFAEKLGLSFVDLANPSWFDNNPRLAWAFYGHRLNMYRQTKPHAGYEILRRWAKEKNDNYFVFTSNVDGHFQKAGFDDEKILEVHGSIHHLQCTRPCSRHIWPADNVNIEIDEERFLAKGDLPKCPHCGAVARPNILMFGDWSWVSDRTDSQENRFNDWLGTVRENGWKLVIIEIGAGTAVPTVRLTDENLAMRYEGFLIRINPREPGIHARINGLSFASGGLETLEKLAQIYDEL